MNPNVGGIDRLLRLVAGVVLVGLAVLPGVQVLGTGGLPWIAGIVGFVLVATAAVRFCPLYALLGIETCPTGKGQ